jgi:hypothetical protein
MRTRSRLRLLMLTAILDNQPPYRPPGFLGTPAKPAACNQCGKKSIRKSGNQYWCRNCNKWFTPGNSANPGKR